MSGSGDTHPWFCAFSWGKAFDSSPPGVMFAVGVAGPRKFSSVPGLLRVFIRNGKQMYYLGLMRLRVAIETGGQPG